MDYSQSFAISAAGMTVERTRVDVAALNVANANTIQTDGVSGYQPMRVVARSGSSGQIPSFAALVDPSDEGQASDLAGFLPAASIEPTDAASRQVYEPDNPLADAKGFLTYPGVDVATEMVSMMGALRAYESNVAAMNVTRTLAMKALDIGGGS